jgi:hypothetical protein
MKRGEVKKTALSAAAEGWRSELAPDIRRITAVATTATALVGAGAVWVAVLA